MPAGESLVTAITIGSARPNSSSTFSRYTNAGSSTSMNASERVSITIDGRNAPLANTNTALNAMTVQGRATTARKYRSTTFGFAVLLTIGSALMIPPPP